MIMTPNFYNWLLGEHSPMKSLAGCASHSGTPSLLKCASAYQMLINAFQFDEDTGTRFACPVRLFIV